MEYSPSPPNLLKRPIWNGRSECYGSLARWNQREQREYTSLPHHWCRYDERWSAIHVMVRWTTCHPHVRTCYGNGIKFKNTTHLQPFICTHGRISLFLLSSFGNNYLLSILYVFYAIHYNTVEIDTILGDFCAFSDMDKVCKKICSFPRVSLNLDIKLNLVLWSVLTLNFCEMNQTKHGTASEGSPLNYSNRISSYLKKIFIC